MSGIKNHALNATKVAAIGYGNEARIGYGDG